jgi:hypothetical protein
MSIENLSYRIPLIVLSGDVLFDKNSKGFESNRNVGPVNSIYLIHADNL